MCLETLTQFVVNYPASSILIMPQGDGVSHNYYPHFHPLDESDKGYPSKNDSKKELEAGDICLRLINLIAMQP